jgi:cob(I)alamin adenosyltransferase
MKVYTRTGDEGMTSLLSGGRVEKSNLRIEAYGTLDELNSVLGLLRCEPLPEGVDLRVTAIQETLFSIGGQLADPESRGIHDSAVWQPRPLEEWIDEMDSELEPLRNFILPGGSRGAALAHVARTVCRRAERRVHALAASPQPVPREVLPYLNRLSDLLFVLARFLNARLGVADPMWRPAPPDG